MAEHTLSHSEKSQGWTSFWSFVPDFMLKLNNRFYTIKNGQLYLHNEDTGVRNNFYGVHYSSKIETVINEANGEDKIFKTMVLESNKPWNVSVKTNFSNSTIKKEEFNQRESRQFAYLRKNENANDLHGNTANGIGVIKSKSSFSVSFESVSQFVSIGDELYQLNGAAQELIGTITNKIGNDLFFTVIVTTPIVGFYSFSKKNARIEGGEIRGYYMGVELENNDTEKVELFAISSNVVKSYV
jgi:hypothetical protein